MAGAQGLPEVVYGPGEGPEEIKGIVLALLGAAGARVLVTRVDLVVAAAAVDVPGAEHDERARLLTWQEQGCSRRLHRGSCDGRYLRRTCGRRDRCDRPGAIGLRVQGDPRRRGRRRPSRCWVTRRLSAAGWPGETVTPTGAALPRALVCQYGPPSAMTIRAHGYGAGTGDDGEGANVLPAVLGEAIGPHPDAQLLTIIETTVDDITGEVLRAVIDYLLADRALDAWAAPVVRRRAVPRT